MSAQNWRTCPKCSNDKNKELEEIKNLYGKIPHDDYHNRLEEAKKKIDNSENLREDWEIFTVEETNELKIYYGCSCEKCNFSFKFKHIESILG